MQGGLVGVDSILSTMMLSLGSMGVVTVLWLLIGVRFVYIVALLYHHFKVIRFAPLLTLQFSMAFGPNLPTKVVGDDTFGPVSNARASCIADLLGASLLL